MCARLRRCCSSRSQQATALGATGTPEAGALENSLDMKRNRNLRALFLGLVLGMGSLFGMPMRPEEIEELMHATNQTRVCQIVREEHDDAGEPPVP
jgi:hypothetical protein